MMHRSILAIVVGFAVTAASLAVSCRTTGTGENARIERGRYLVNHVSLCFLCHSEVDWKREGFPPLPGRAGVGGLWRDESVPFATLYAANLTPDETGIGSWSDAELDRAIRRGIGKDGRTLFPVMPYNAYRAMSDSDVAAVIAYLRSLVPVKNAVPARKLPAAVEVMLKPVEVMRPPEGRGHYLVQIADCFSCHTPLNPAMQANFDLAFGGGFIVKGPWGRVASPNITPDPSGIPHYDEAMFIRLMRTGTVGGRQVNGIMPWGHYRGMTDEDLKAMFGVIRALRPVQHRVDNVEEPSKCPKCGTTHGLGKRNVR